MHFFKIKAPTYLITFNHSPSLSDRLGLTRPDFSLRCTEQDDCHSCKMLQFQDALLTFHLPKLLDGT